jgi:hypothetical protein
VAESFVAHKLVDVLRALPPAELKAIIERLGLTIDPAKRLDPPSQLARALVALPELREPSRLPEPSLGLLHRVAEAKGTLRVPAVPAALTPLAARGLMFARGTKTNVELVLPIAYLVQLRSWAGEDPRGMRALLAQASLETASAIAGHYLGRPATPPISLSLEAAWDVLGDTDRLAAEIEKLSPTERRVLEGVEREGGEVDTEELLELEREPLRLRTATGATPSRRGVGFSLERRGLLIPVHPNRHVIPTEVSRIIGAKSHEEREQRRAQVLSFVLSGDHAPRRARFSLDPAPLALGMTLATLEPGSEVKPNIGTPKSLIVKHATRFGRDSAHVALVCALSRAIGLWDPSAMNAGAPPGSLAQDDLASHLFHAWTRGGAWDEARKEPEVLRLTPDARDGSPVGAVRDMVLEALRDLGEDRWVPWSQLAGYLKSDHRVPGLTRLFRRWAERTGADVVEPIDVARRIVLESLPALGVIDLGDGPDDDADGSAAPEPTDGDAPSEAATLRLTPRGRALLSADRHERSEKNEKDAKPEKERTKSKFLDTHVLRIGGSGLVHAILAIGTLVEVGRASDTLDLIVAPQTLAKALAAGFEADQLRARIEAVASLPESLSRTLAQASVVLGRATFAPASGFLWVEDGNLLEMLRTRRSTAELFVEPSPPSGLLVQAGVDLDKLARRCRTIGIEVVADGNVIRARAMPSGMRTPVPRSVTPAPGKVQAVSRTIARSTTPAGGRTKAEK